MILIINHCNNNNIINDTLIIDGYKIHILEIIIIILRLSLTKNNLRNIYPPNKVNEWANADAFIRIHII